MTTSCSFTRVGSSLFARSANESVFDPGPWKVTKRDCCRCTRLGSTGNGRSSPSESSPAFATAFTATVNTFFGAVSA